MKKTMKLYKIFLPMLIIGILLPAVVRAQGIGLQKQHKNVSEGRNLTVSNTLMAVGMGIGTAYLFKDETARMVGASLAIYGLVMGPSNGNFYAQDYLRGGMGVMARTGAGYLMLDATREILGDRVAEPLGWDNKPASLTDTKVLVGAGIFLGSFIYNYLTIETSVNEYNRSLYYSLAVTSQSVLNEEVPLLTARISF